jgi:molybdate/tungstate transport system substrate-binding protein
MKRPLSRQTVALVTIASLLASCRASNDRSNATLTILTAGALARPLRAAADSFTAGSVPAALESAGSLETARKITDLGRRPDVVALADTALFSALLAPYTGPVTALAHTRMVLAYTARSRFADVIDSTDWFRVIQRPGVEVGRSDPTLDPAGYRALLVAELAERHYGIPGLAKALVAHAPQRNVRPKSADLVALLQTGNLDYAWEYESVARGVGLRYVRLPAAIDLGDPALAPQYAAATVRVPGAHGRQIIVHGAPVVFGIAPLRGAPTRLGTRFIAFLSSPAGKRILAGFSLEALDARDTADTR